MRSQYSRPRAGRLPRGGLICLSYGGIVNTRRCEWCRTVLPKGSRRRYCSDSCRTIASRERRRERACAPSHPWLAHGLTDAERAIAFAESLSIPEGPRAGEPVRLAPYQRSYIEGALGRDTSVAVLSIARGNAKTATAAALALGGLLGVWDGQPRRDVILAARVRDQARVAWQFAEGFARTLPEEYQKRLKFRRSPRLEIELEAEDGPHVLRAIAADGKSALGAGPTLVLMDERAFWPEGRGEELEQALLTACGKRGARTLIMSTSADSDAHAFSRWVDAPPAGTFVQEHRAPPGLPADDLPSLLTANPGAEHGVGASPGWLQGAAERAISRGGSALACFRALHRNERVSTEARDVLVTVDEWLACEADSLPPRSGPCVIGLDLGGSRSMSAAAWFWPKTGRLESLGVFPSQPSLAERGVMDGVGRRYAEMAERGELRTMGGQIVPAAEFIAEAMRRVEGERVTAICADRFRQAEVMEAAQAAGVRAPFAWRGQGFRDGGEDVERFRRAVFDGRVASAPSLLMRSALTDAVCVSDEAGNRKLAKARSTGRIDAAAAAVLAVGEGSRQTARPIRQARAPVWV